MTARLITGTIARHEHLGYTELGNSKYLVTIELATADGVQEVTYATKPNGGVGLALNNFVGSRHAGRKIVFTVNACGHIDGMSWADGGSEYK